MSFFYKDLYPRDITSGSVDFKEKLYTEVVKDGVTNSVLKSIDPANEIVLPNFDDYSLEKRLKAGVDIDPVSLNVTDEPDLIDDEIKNTILSDSSVSSSKVVDSNQDDSNQDDSNLVDFNQDDTNV